jgi:xanthine/uracil permease
MNRRQRSFSRFMAGTNCLPAVTQPFLGGGIIIGTIAAVTLNILLPDPGNDHVGLKSVKRGS